MAESTIDLSVRTPEPAPAEQEQSPDRAARLRAGARRRLRSWLRQPGLVLAVLVLLTVLAWALAPGLFAPRDPLRADPAHIFEPPGPGAWFGTDYLGRDLYSRVVHGASLSLRAPVVAVALGLVSGTTVGLLAGALGGWVDALLMRAVDVLLAIPGILVSLAVVTALGFGTVHVAVAVGLASLPGFARITRAQVLRVLGEPYVEAATASGVRRPVVLLTHVLPNVRGPVLSLAALELGTAVLAVAALGFLGFGAQPPTPEWGSMVSEGRDYLGDYWWFTTLPGLTLALVTLSVNRIARSVTHRRTH
ncbi:MULTISPECIES: ABC transporter permease [Streptacidiphilus]|uniref:ABC transporter permease n=2 Tax=Streptacidiphilus TaxID=228398 RepID=A0ABV6UMM7_9ACTN|nr:ABC transporter permease [Streptacidiphilus jeojiense]